MRILASKVWGFHVFLFLLVLSLITVPSDLAHASSSIENQHRDAQPTSPLSISDAQLLWTSGNVLPGLLNFADMDGDGSIDIIAVSEGGMLWWSKHKILVIGGKTYEKKWDYEVKGKVSGIPAVGKILDDDNWLDLAVACNDGKVFVYDGSTKALAWEYNTRGSIEASPVSADIDGDGLMDIVIGSSNRYVHIVDGGTGELLWQFRTKGKLRSTVAIGDLDIDGVLDIVAVDDAGFVYAIDTQKRDAKWRFATAGSLTRSPCIADIDGDGVRQDVIIGDNDCNIYVINGSTGRQLWRKSILPYSPDFGVSVADVDGDSVLEILALSSDDDGAELHVIDGRNGSGIWRQSIEVAGATTPIPVDIDDDGSLEIAVGGSGYIYLIDGFAGQRRYGYSVGKGDFLCSAALDVCGDGVLEFAVVNTGSGSTHIMSTYSKGTVQWAKMYGDCHNTGSRDAALAYANEPIRYPRRALSEGPVTPPPEKLPKLGIFYDELPDEINRVEPNEIVLSVMNSGEESSEAVKLIIKSKSAVIRPVLELGDLAPGQKESASVTFVIPEHVQRSLVEIRVVAVDSDFRRSDEQIIQLRLKRLQPCLIITEYETDDHSYGNGNGKAEPGETIRLDIRYSNSGRGSARNARAELVHTEVTKDTETQKLLIGLDMSVLDLGRRIEHVPVSIGIDAYIDRAKVSSAEVRRELMIHDRHKLPNGERWKIAMFVDPRDKYVTSAIPMEIRGTGEEKARVAFSILQSKEIHCVGAGSSQIQYPRELLRVKFGSLYDCSLLYAAVLESLGVEAKLIFDSDEMLPLYRHQGEWLPVDMNMLSECFEAARSSGEKLEDTMLSQNAETLALRDAWEETPPLRFPELAHKDVLLSRSAEQYAGQNELRDAARIFSELLGRYPDESVVLNNAANVDLLMGNLQQALAKYTQAAKWAPDDGGIYLNIGIVYSKLGDEQKSIEFLERAYTKLGSYAVMCRILNLDEENIFYREVDTLLRKAIQHSTEVLSTALGTRIIERSQYPLYWKRFQ